MLNTWVFEALNFSTLFLVNYKACLRILWGFPGFCKELWIRNIKVYIYIFEIQATKTCYFIYIENHLLKREVYLEVVGLINKILKKIFLLIVLLQEIRHSTVLLNRIEIFKKKKKKEENFPFKKYYFITSDEKNSVKEA